VNPAVDPSRGKPNTAAPAPQPRRWSLLWRLLATNAAVMGAALVFLSVTPATVPAPGSLALESIVLLVIGITAMLATNLFLLRRALDPLRRLTDLMHRIDPLRPGQRIPVYGHDAEVADLTRAFNEMLERLEDERRDATGRAVTAQEGERRRIAQELHDEIGQGLTAALLQLEGAMREAPSSLKPKLAGATESVRGSLEEAREVASRLRPEALDDLGLVSALSALGKRLAKQTGLRIDLELFDDLPSLAPEDEIVVYRVAQEALTNVLRHADATGVRVCLDRHAGVVRLRVVDNGVGLDGAEPGGGVRGMRERAVLIGADLTIEPGEHGGLAVTLDVPVEAAE
jgi:two-component system sensor histidine kinase UhpB